MDNMKFRAWDKDERAMLDVHGINFDAQGIWTNELIDDESDGNFIFLDDVVLMQSTGLKDKKGVEIYEGDIVKNIYDEIYVVKWFDAGFHLEEKYNGGFDYFELHSGDNKEVIGNIYQHSHLLEDN
ncbi:YopX family protein [Staphylococcus epidermidis]|uniref:YopX family protein n=1 Tax=Staphylococcus epidermidis TaxID=1282 RepID=UPI003EE082B5